MPERSSTLTDSVGPHRDDGMSEERSPGLGLLFYNGQPLATVISLAEGPVELGRGSHGLAADPRMSRRHARVWLDGNRIYVADLGSQNGTACDGRAISANQPTEAQRVVRMGNSLFGVFRNVLPLASKGVVIGTGKVLGPSLQQLIYGVQQSASFGTTLHLTGESGTGKELLAQAFHDTRPRSGGRFVPVNCAAIPSGLAERLLFGTKRGAYSGADANAEGYIQAAAGGTLFLDEVGDLDLSIQAKLLRVLETKELLPLGASRPGSIEFHICSATNKDLKNQVALGRFREDLYYRIGRPSVSIPPLRKRPEEIPWLIDAELKRFSLPMTPHISLIETCLLRPWPGNVRELLIEIRTAAQTAAIEGVSRVEARHLHEGAGMALRSLDNNPISEEMTPPPLPVRPFDPAELSRLETALRAHHGNVSGAARDLGLHRTQLRRLLERYGLDPQRYALEDKQSLDSGD